MRVLYIVNGLRAPSHTFIRDEIAFHVKNGIAIDVVDLAPNVRGAASDEPMPRPAAAHPRPTSNFVQLFHAAAGAAMRGLRIPLGRPWADGPFSPYYLARSLERIHHAPDIVHCHFGTVGLCAARLKKKGLLPGKLITTFHGFDINSVPRYCGPRVYETLFQEGDLFLPVSRQGENQLLEMGCPAGRTAVQRMGVDCETLRFEERRLAPGEPVRLVATGRLTEVKGHVYTLKALSILERARISWTLDVIGDGADRRRLRRVAAKFGLGPRVRFHGALNHAESLEVMRRGMLFVLPSVTARTGHQEGVPVAIMEAMAMGIPVLSTSHGGIPELVDHGVSGLLSRERDAEGLAAHLEMLMTRPDLWASFGRAGRGRVERDFNRARVSAELAERYRRLGGSASVS